MSFRQYKTTVSAAVATNGTFTFSLTSAGDWGSAKLQGDHTMYAEGLQAMLSFAAGDFTLSASGTTVTVTYKGTTSIPAGSTVRIQLEVAGDDNYLARNKVGINGADVLGNPRWCEAKPVRVIFGNPAANDTSTVRAVAALAVTAVQTLATPYTMDVPRNVTISSSGADTSVITIKGTDEYGVALTENLTLNAATAVSGNKAFKTIISYAAPTTAPSNNLSIGLGASFGLPFFVPGAGGNGGTGIGYVIKETLDGTTPTAGTLAGGDLTVATATTKDVRGLYTPNSAPNGTRAFEIVMSSADTAFLGVNQFGS